MVAGKVRIHAVAIRHNAIGCTPAPEATMVPAMPPVISGRQHHVCTAGSMNC